MTLTAKLVCAVLALVAHFAPCQTPIQLSKSQSLPDVPQWVTVAVDQPINASGLTSGGSPYWRGRRTGRNTWSVDIWGKPSDIDGDTFTQQAVPAQASHPKPQAIPPLPPMVNGQPMHLVRAFTDGARVVGQFRVRVGSMMCLDLWLWRYWGRNSIVHGEALLVASNPGVADIRTTCPRISISLGGAPPMVYGPGAAPTPTPTPFPEVDFGNGQAMAMPMFFVTGVPTDAECYGAHASALSKAWPLGTPKHPTEGFTKSPATFVRDFGGPAWGPARFSGSTGNQNDQVFTCGDTVNASSAYAVYLTSLKYANRACHHLEHDGEIVDKRNHPSLVYWDARVHWHHGVSPDRLGKADGFWSNNGWSGPDVEHWLIGTLAAGDRWSPFYVHDVLMEHQAHIYLMQWTHAPNMVTSQTYASRAGGWEALAVSLLYEGLADRELAERVKDNFFQRFEKVFKPAIKPILDPRIDNRLYQHQPHAPFSGDLSWMPWQQSIYAMGFEYAGRYFGNQGMIDAAVSAAQTCLELDWFLVDGQWRALGNQPVDPVRRQEYLDVVDWSRIPPWYDGSWSAQSILVLNRQRPSAKVTEILESILPRMKRSWVDETMSHR